MTRAIVERSTGHVVGKHPKGWFVVEMRLTTTRKDALTVDHEPVDTVTEFAASGEIWRRRNSPDCMVAGQCLDELWHVEPRADWRERDLLSLWAVWTRWHLNSMRAGCAHQQVLHESSQGYERPDLEHTRPCYRTGYRYGSAWLYEPIPRRVDDEMRRLHRLLVAGESWR